MDLSISIFLFYTIEFEWTREEFKEWVETKIINCYPEYEAHFDGVGEGPGHIGHCSQMAVIIRKDFQTMVCKWSLDNTSNTLF